MFCRVFNIVSAVRNASARQIRLQNKFTQLIKCQRPGVGPKQLLYRLLCHPLSGQFPSVPRLHILTTLTSSTSSSRRDTQSSTSDSSVRPAVPSLLLLIVTNVLSLQWVEHLGRWSACSTHLVLLSPEAGQLTNLTYIHPFHLHGHWAHVAWAAEGSSSFSAPCNEAGEFHQAN